MLTARSLLLRADAEPAIHTGHVMRCLALAEQAREEGWPALLVTRKSEGLTSRLAAARGIDCVEIPEGLGESEDARRTLEAARSAGAEVILVDHYGLGPAWWSIAAEVLPLAVIDDLGREGLAGVAALVLNQNAGVSPAWYRGVRRVLRGPRYTLLRREFLPWRPAREERTAAEAVAPPRPPAVLLTFGGCDPARLTPRGVRALRALEEPFTAEVLLGPGSASGQESLAAAAGDARFSFHRAPAEVARLLAGADLAITAGGTTLYECAFLGLPALALAVADNQEAHCRALDRCGAVRYLGRVEEVSEGDLAAAAGELLRDEVRRRRMGGAGRSLVDGRGAERVLAALRGLAGPPSGERRARTARGGREEMGVSCPPAARATSLAAGCGRGAQRRTAPAGSRADGGTGERRAATEEREPAAGEARETGSTGPATSVAHFGPAAGGSPGPLTLRPATLEDAELLLAWRNDPLTRRMSLHDRLVERAEHEVWLGRALRDPDRLLLIGMEGGMPIGQVRLDVAGGQAEISLTVAPEHRGRGLAGRLIRFALAWLGHWRGEIPVLARIKEVNGASRRAFAASGFVLEKVEEERGELVGWWFHRGPPPGRN